MLDFRVSLDQGPFLAVGPVTSAALLATLTLKSSRKRMKALLVGGAAGELPTMEQLHEAKLRMVIPCSQQ